MGIVYLICDPETNYYKIGVTRGDIEKRLKKLQTGNSTELFVVSIYHCQYPFRLEKMLHMKYSSQRVLNEWFDLDIYDVTHFKEICKAQDDIISFMLCNPYFAKNLH